MQQRGYKNYLLGLLTVILIFNFVDRVALGLVLQDIKADLQLSDTQLGLLSGIAFALFYSVMGIPIARWADRGNRVTIISATAALWSAAVALCATAGSFIHLLLIRVVVAVGEAGCTPPALSLIADYFTRAERPRAAAIYGMGAPASTLVGFFLAGWLNELYGWRVTFVVLGLPGLVLAALTWLTIREPRRTRCAPSDSAARIAAVTDAVQPSLKEVCVTLWNSATFVHLLLCISVMLFFSYGIFLWLPAFFIRSYGMATGEIGTWLAVTWGLGGVIGAYVGGALATRYAANNERLQLRALAIVIACSGGFSTLAYFSTNQYAAFALIGVSTLGLATVNGPLFATIQTLVPERMRAVALALVYLFGNLIGMGLGPLAAGALSDAFHPWAGEESLRYALLILSPGYCWCAWHSWRAAKTVARDLADIDPTPGHIGDKALVAAGSADRTPFLSSAERT